MGLSTSLADDERFRENIPLENNINSVTVHYITKKPVTKKPVTKKPVTKKPVTKKPVKKKRKRRDVCNWDKKIFQLKMFWEEGMEWQEDPKEKAWCAECYGDCVEGEKVHIKECDEDDTHQQWYFYKCTVRPKRNQRLCITAGETRSGSDRGSIELHTCKSKKKIQYFETFDPNDVSKKFQFKFFKPGKEDLCLTQEHHPFDEELLRFVECKRAEENDKGVYDDTSHWVVGEFGGHPLN